MRMNGEPGGLICAECPLSRFLDSYRRKCLVALGGSGVVGHACTDASIPASKIYEQAGVLQMSPIIVCAK